jgi:hypothetical protein
MEVSESDALAIVQEACVGTVRTHALLQHGNALRELHRNWLEAHLCLGQAHHRTVRRRQRRIPVQRHAARIPLSYMAGTFESKVLAAAHDHALCGDHGQALPAALGRRPTQS